MGMGGHRCDGLHWSNRSFMIYFLLFVVGVAGGGVALWRHVKKTNPYI